MKLQNRTGKRNFQSKTKAEKKNSKKKTKVWPSKVYPVRMEAITSGKIRYYKEKTKGLFEIARLKKKRAVGKRYPGHNQ